jgi:hypothetical protein
MNKLGPGVDPDFLPKPGPGLLVAVGVGLVELGWLSCHLYLLISRTLFEHIN